MGISPTLQQEFTPLKYIDTGGNNYKVNESLFSNSITKTNKNGIQYTLVKQSLWISAQKGNTCFLTLILLLFPLFLINIKTFIEESKKEGFFTFELIYSIFK